MLIRKRADQNQGRQLVSLAGRIVRHGVLDLVVGQREVVALAELVLVDIVGVHQDDGNAGILLQFVAQFHRVRRVDQGDLFIAFKAGAEIWLLPMPPLALRPWLIHGA